MQLADTSGVGLRANHHTRMNPADKGFSLIEQIIAMTVIVGALIGLLSTVGATAKGLTISRQRTIGISLAKQAIENLEGSAYNNVAMNLAGLSTDPLIQGTTPNFTFEGEFVVPGGTTPSYKTTIVSVGTTFVLRTFVTSVTAAGSGYRRVTTIIEWPSTSPAHTMRFSTLVFPLDYASYPSSSGDAEATGGLISVNGQLGGDTIEDLHLALPAVRSDTNASTLRTSIGAAASATGFVDLLDGPVTGPGCTASGTDVGECPRQTDDSIADNDFTSTTGSWVSGVGRTFVAGNLLTPGGTTLTTPAGTMTSRTSTDACGICGFGDSDGLPWSDASVTTTTASTAGFNSNHGVGVLSGSFWTMGGAWTPSASIDHDSTGGGLVTSTAQLSAPAVRVLDLVGGPAGYAGAVKVSTFTAKATAASGYTLAAPDVATGTTTMQIQLWDGAAYRTVNLLPGAALDTAAAASLTIGDHIVSFTSRVQAQPSNFSTLGTAPRGDAAAQHPSILLITVEVTITSATLKDTPPTTTTVPTTSTTTTTTTTIPATTTTTSPTTTTTGATSTSTSTTSTSTTSAPTTTAIPAPPLVTDHFTIAVDYGRVSAHTTWLAKAA